MATALDQQPLGAIMTKFNQQPLQTLQALVRELEHEMAPSLATASTLVRAENRTHLAMAQLGALDPESWQCQHSSLYQEAKGYKTTKLEWTLAALD